MDMDFDVYVYFANLKLYFKKKKILYIQFKWMQKHTNRKIKYIFIFFF